MHENNACFEIEDEEEDLEMSDLDGDEDEVHEKSERGESDDDDDEEEEVETKVMEFNGMKFECKGNYSQCPVCHKEIKSTFIFRHIRL